MFSFNFHKKFRIYLLQKHTLSSWNCRLNEASCKWKHKNKLTPHTKVGEMSVIVELRRLWFKFALIK